jgi:hypothetical protein
VESIFKYQLEVTDEQTIELPIGAKVLSVGNQREFVFMWALVNTGSHCNTEKRIFVIKGTGHSIEDGDLDGARFIGTVMLMGGSLIFHVFERV